MKNPAFAHNAFYKNEICVFFKYYAPTVGQFRFLQQPF